MEFNILEEEMQWLCGSIVDKTKSQDGALQIQQVLHREGQSSIYATSIGSNMVLLTGENENSVKKFLDHSASSLGNWFTEINKWSPEFVVKDRWVWLTVIGVPAHAWPEEVFRRLVQMAGKFVGLDDATRLKQRLDVGRVLNSNIIN